MTRNRLRYSNFYSDALSALSEDIVGANIPIPLSLYEMEHFLRSIKFEWTTNRPGTAQFRKMAPRKANEFNYQLLRMIFDTDNLEFEAMSSKTIQVTGLPELFRRRPLEYSCMQVNGDSETFSLLDSVSMLSVARFMHDESSTILYYTNRSRFSIRHPSKVRRSKSRPLPRIGHGSGLEVSSLSQLGEKSFFMYRRYPNVETFFDSSEFRAAERKYPTFMHLDIANCFGSIYTHSISWVTNGKLASKRFTKATDFTFGGKFDKLMQHINHGETSGILIGPEISRIFAEIILQEIDVQVESTLHQEDLLFGRDYEIFRFLDDYFVFVRRPEISEFVKHTLRRALSDFKLKLNALKGGTFRTPLMSNLARAQLRARRSLDSYLLRGRANQTSNDEHERACYNSVIGFSVSDAILDYKSIIHECEVMPGFLSEFYFRKMIEDISSCTENRHQNRDSSTSKSAKLQEDLRYVLDVLDFALFLYSGSPTIDSSVLLANLIRICLGSLRRNEFSSVCVQIFRDKLYRELVAQINSNNFIGELGTENLVLLNCLLDCGVHISHEVLQEILNRRNLEIAELDPFSLLTLLRFHSIDTPATSQGRELLESAKSMVSDGTNVPFASPHGSLVRLSLISFKGCSDSELAEVIGVDEDFIVSSRMRLKSWIIRFMS